MLANHFPTSQTDDEAGVNGSLVADLGLSPEVWLFLSLLGCVTLFFKFSRIWSVRNLDLLLLFVLAPGLMLMVSNRASYSWGAYIWLFLGSGLWLVRCLLDLGLMRRPLLEPNLNASGLLCLSVGILGLLLAETVSLPVEDGAARNPAEPSGRENGTTVAPGDDNPALRHYVDLSPLPTSLKRKSVQVIVSRVLASLAHLSLVLTLLAIGWRHFERPLTGMAMAACYLLLPYTRMALVDSGQLIPAALIAAAVLWHLRPRPGGCPDRPGGRLGPGLSRLDRALVRFFHWPRRFAVHRGRAGRCLFVCLAGLLGSRLGDLGARPGRPEYRRGRSVAAIRAPVFDQFLDADRLELSVACADCLPGPGDCHDVLARQKEPGRADRPFCRPARRQPVLVSRQRRHPCDALPSTGDRDDVSTDPDDPKAPGSIIPAAGETTVFASFFAIRSAR